MNKSEHEHRVVPLAAATELEALPYAVELWTLTRDEAERVLGRAASLQLANAVFAAAQSDYVGRKLVLKRGEKVLAESP